MSGYVNIVQISFFKHDYFNQSPKDNHKQLAEATVIDIVNKIL
jgi:hypothetical protein